MIKKDYVDAIAQGINFHYNQPPLNPVVGDAYLSNGQLVVWTGGAWAVVGSWTDEEDNTAFNKSCLEFWEGL